MESLMFLLKLAWESRYRLPLLITVGLMVLDIRMQLEINVQTRTVRRARQPNTPEHGALPTHEELEDSSLSWSTYDEETEDEEDLEELLTEAENELSENVTSPAHFQRVQERERFFETFETGSRNMLDVNIEN